MSDLFSIAILSSASGGGAGIAAKRICDALNQEPDIKADFVDILRLGEQAPPQVFEDNVILGKYTNTHFTGEYTGFVRGWLIDFLSEYDAINVHWASYLLTTSELLALAKRGKKILITMHDFYYSTGGCHYQAGCTGQKVSCNICPQVNSSLFSLKSVKQAYAEKKELLRLPNVEICSPSSFVSSTVAALGLIDRERAHTIRNIYHSPSELDLSSKSPTRDIMMIADSLEEKRKGAELAIEALALASRQSAAHIRIQFVGRSSDALIQLCKQRGLDAHFHGRITEHKELVDIYQRCSILLSCSYEDNWPNVLVEGGSHGVIPVVGSGHGCEEFCRKYGVGTVVKEYTGAAFAKALLDLLISFPKDEQINAFSEAVRHDHSTAVIGRQYLALLNPTVDRSVVEDQTEFSPAIPSRVSENYVTSGGGYDPEKLKLVEKEGPFSEIARSFSRYGLPIYDINS